MDDGTQTATATTRFSAVDCAVPWVLAAALKLLRRVSNPSHILSGSAGEPTHLPTALLRPHLASPARMKELPADRYCSGKGDL